MFTFAGIWLTFHLLYWCVSSAVTAEGDPEFGKEFREPVHEAATRLNLEDMDFMANGASNEPIIRLSAEMTSALKDLATRMHKT